MDSHDFIQKQIDEASDVLKQLIAKVKSKRKSKKKNDLIEILNQDLMKLINLDLIGITVIPIESFILKLTSINKLNTHNLDLLAQLFFETGLSTQNQLDKEQTKRLFNRSLHIYQYLLKAEVDFTYERHIQIKKLKEILLQ